MNQITDFLKSQPIAAIVMVLGVVGVLACSFLFMPASELMPAVTYTSAGTAPLMPGLSPVRSEAGLDFFKGVGEALWGTNNLKQVADQPMPDGAPGDVRSYTQYAIWLGAALVF